MSDIKTIHPEVMYAERSSADEPEKNIIYFTISAPDIQGEPKIDIKPTEISFSAKAGDASKGVPEKHYAFDLQFYEEIIPEETKKMITSRAVVLVLRKKNVKAEYWLRLTKEKPNRNWVKTDFSKWVDEDEQNESADKDMDTEGMGGMGGMGGGGGGGMDMASMMGGMGGGGGGMGGMDLASMMGGGGGGAGGMGGMDFSKMMEQMGAAGGMPGLDDDEGDDEGEGEGEGDAEDASAPAADKGKGKEASDSKLEDVE